MTQPQIWHYGLVALYWAELQTEGGPEEAYFRTAIDRSGQPALDLGCGTGRLLLPYVRAGLDVDGCDYSPDMLALCRDRAAREGLAPGLYQQALHELDLPRRYLTIYACGMIGLGGDWRHAAQGLQRCYEHLRSGGTLAFDYNPRWNDPPAWLSRLPGGRAALPQEWPDGGEREFLPDGSEIELVSRTIAMDPLEEVATRQIRARLWRSGKLVQEEVHTQKVGDFSVHEWIMMLERAGFSDIRITGDYTGEPATADHETLVFLARK